MSLTRVRASGWAPHEQLASADMTQVDINAALGIDRRGDTVDNAAPIQVNGAVALADADLTIRAAVRMTGYGAAPIATIFPVFNQLGDADSAIDGKATIQTVFIDQITTQRNFNILRAGALAGNLVLVSRSMNTVATGCPIYDDVLFTGTQIGTISTKGWALFVFTGTVWKGVANGQGIF